MCDLLGTYLISLSTCHTCLLLWLSPFERVGAEQPDIGETLAEFRFNNLAHFFISVSSLTLGVHFFSFSHQLPDAFFVKRKKLLQALNLEGGHFWIPWGQARVERTCHPLVLSFHNLAMNYKYSVSLPFILPWAWRELCVQYLGTQPPTHPHTHKHSCTLAPHPFGLFIYCTLHPYLICISFVLSLFCCPPMGFSLVIISLFLPLLWHHTKQWHIAKKFQSDSTNFSIKLLWVSVTYIAFFLPVLQYVIKSTFLIPSSTPSPLLVFALVCLHCLCKSCPSGSIDTLSLSLWLFWLGSCVVLRRAEALI